jgi:hypothetical protein
MAQVKKTVYLVKYQAANGGQRFYDKQQAEAAAAALKRTGYKRVRIVPRAVR